MAKVKKDLYINVGYGSVTMSAANTLTFSAIQFAIGLFQGIAILMHRVLWYPSAPGLREIVAGTDSLSMAITTSNRLASISYVSDPGVFTLKEIIGIAAGTERVETPLADDFTNLPGGGRLLAANPIYVAANSGGFVAAATVKCELQFTFVELADRDYMELIQSQFPANVS